MSGETILKVVCDDEATHRYTVHYAGRRYALASPIREDYEYSPNPFSRDDRISFSFSTVFLSHEELDQVNKPKQTKRSVARSLGLRRPK
ncbi:hypothetical protein KIV64_gp55 [Mycobacterium phage DroogsArmy]|uniref:Uncharacterized protein n=1 Tax=Mycobacterium phage DroogsArmy TaxID=2744011 RepID=A0A6N0A5L3_9CAUD|nr:hypothetical protein KIV64_gp55 [Mycobacterium phage DroogsArmy]QKO02433.1 hypothetical protein SEA_DROOGSARMY_37 [Mycobacterium phage DroogsArmy]